jgi:hypothetical protein
MEGLTSSRYASAMVKLFPMRLQPTQELTAAPKLKERRTPTPATQLACSMHFSLHLPHQNTGKIPLDNTWLGHTISLEIINSNQYIPVKFP